MIALLLTLCVALGFSPPPFDADQHVYLVPSDLDQAVGLTDAATTLTQRPVYVVVVRTVKDGPLSAYRESWTEQALEQIWESWSTQGFDFRQGNLIVLGLDEREVRLRAGTRWDAEYGLAQSRLLPVIDRTFLPHARAGDLDQGLASLVRGIDSEISAVILQQARQEQVMRVLRWLPLVLLVFGVSGGLVVWVVVARVRSASAREVFEQALDERKQAVERGRQRLATLNLDVELRDRVVALKIKGPVTSAAVHEVVTRLSELHAGLAALEKRLQHIEQTTAQGTSFESLLWKQARAALDAPFEIDTKEVQDRLFDTPTRIEQVSPTGFMEDLASDWNAVADQWARVLDAVDASMRTADQDVTTVNLDRGRALLTEAGLPTGWCDDHPLARGAESVVQRLDGLRKEDPLAYLDELERLAEQDRRILARSERIAVLPAALDAAWATVDEGSVAGHETTFRDPAEQPEHLRSLARSADVALRGALQRALDPEGTLAEGRRVLEALEDLAKHQQRIALAVASARTVVDKARATVAALSAARARAQASIREVLKAHDADHLQQAWTELREATDDEGEAKQALVDAEAALAERAHLDATRLAAQAVREVEEANADLQELAAALAALEARREEAQAARQALQGVLDSYRREARSYAPYGADALTPGLALWATIEAASWDAPGDWSERLQQVHDAQKALRTGLSDARRHHQLAVERRRAAEAAERRLREASHSSDDWGSSSSSWGSSYSSSSSSSSRSAGRSFSSSGRSAGRRW